MAKKTPFIERYTQCFSIRNLYIDTEENKNRTNGVISKTELYARDTEDKLTFAYILHDRDICNETEFDEYENIVNRIGDLKKPHYHLYIKLPYPVQVADILTKWNIKESEIDIFEPKAYRNKVLYLTHVCHPEKTQYKVEEIHTNKIDYVNTIHYEYQPISDPVTESIELLSSVDRRVSYMEIISTLKGLEISMKSIQKYWNMIKALVDDHNIMYSVSEPIEQKLTKEYVRKYSQIEKDNSIVAKLVNQFDSVDYIDEFGNKLRIMLIDKKKGK